MKHAILTFFAVMTVATVTNAAVRPVVKPTPPPPPCIVDSSTGGLVAPQGYSYCTPPSSGGSSGGSSSTSTTAYPVGYIPFISEIVDFLTSASAQSAENARRKAAMQAYLEAERKAAIERKQAEEVARLDGILLRLRSTLKGLGPGNDLQLKLSPTGPIRFGEYMSTPATQTSGAQLTLKTGDDATKSLQAPPPSSNASSAGVINPNQPPAFNADNMTTEQRELTDMLKKLTPEQQKQLLASIRNSETAAATTETQTQQTATQPTGSSPEETKKSETLTLKLSTDQKTADDLKAAANNGASPEQLKQQGDDQFKQLQQTTLTSTQTTTDASKPSVGKTSPPAPADASKKVPAASDPCISSPNSDPNTVDLRCATAATKNDFARTKNAEQTATIAGDGTSPKDHFDAVILDRGLYSLTETQKWSPEEQARLHAYLDNSELGPGFPDQGDTIVNGVRTGIRDREVNLLTMSGATRYGPDLFKQPWEQKYGEASCTIYALASASGLSYWEVWGKAAELIRNATWRSSDEREDPLLVLKRGGLTGSEIAFIAESIGQVEAVKPDSFATAIKGGRPIMINIRPGHEVVLEKTFEAEGQTWFVMVNSSKSGAWTRQLATYDDLKVLLLENGMAFTPDHKLKF